MLAVTGDVHGHPRAPIERSVALLMEALAGVRVRGPRLAVLGNHDPASMAGCSRRGLRRPGQPLDPLAAR